MKENYLVCYDIRDPVRLTRVYNYMKGRGRHLQYSVFFCVLTYSQLKQIKDDLRQIINPGEDDVRIYPLPRNFEVIVLGCGDRLPEGVLLFQ